MHALKHVTGAGRGPHEAPAHIKILGQGFESVVQHGAGESKTMYAGKMQHTNLVLAPESSIH